MGAPLFTLDNPSPYIEDYVPSEQNMNSQYNNPQYNQQQYNNQPNNNQGMYFDQQDMSSDMKMPMMKKKELIGNESGEMEHFRGDMHGGAGFSGGHGAGFSGSHGGMNRGSFSGSNRPMNRGGFSGGIRPHHGSSGYNRLHHGPHHGRNNRWNNNWNPYYAGAGLAGYGLGNYYDGQNYVVDDGYYYDDNNEPPVVQNIYINDDNEKQQQESPIKIENISTEESTRKKKLKKFKKVKEELTEGRTNKKELSKQTLYGIIVFLVILVLILGFKLLIDYKMIRF